jgi:hypothetical protein
MCRAIRFHTLRCVNRHKACWRRPCAPQRLPLESLCEKAKGRSANSGFPSSQRWLPGEVDHGPRSSSPPGVCTSTSEPATPATVYGCGHRRGPTSPSGASREKYLKKIPQPGEFNDLPSRQNSGDQFTLRSGVNLIQMQLRYRLRRELPYAFVKSALSNEVGSGATDRFITE